MSVNERPARRPLTVSRRGKQVEREFTVVATSKVRAERELRRHGIYRGAVYRDYLGNRPDPFLLCESVRIEPEGREIMGDSNNAYIGVAQYESKAFARNGLEIVPDGPAIASTDLSLDTEEADVDHEGNPIINTAGVPPETPFQTTKKNEVVMLEWIWTGYGFNDALGLNRRFSNVLNTNTWQGAPPLCLKMHGLNPIALNEEAFTNSRYGMVKFEAKVEFRPERTIFGETFPGFVRVRPSMGRSRRNPNFDPLSDDPEETRPTLPIMEGHEDTEEQQQIQHPVYLDSEGQPIFMHYDEEGQIVFSEGKSPVIQSWQILPDDDFGDIGIEY